MIDKQTPDPSLSVQSQGIACTEKEESKYNVVVPL